MYDVDPRPAQQSPGYQRLFGRERLTVGVFFPIESFRGDTPTMQGQVELARFAEQAGFDALWFRDVPLRDPSFGDVGQVYDPFVYLGHICCRTVVHSAPAMCYLCATRCTPQRLRRRTS
jgi:hypothetical protein